MKTEEFEWEIIHLDFAGRFMHPYFFGAYAKKIRAWSRSGR